VLARISVWLALGVLTVLAGCVTRPPGADFPKLESVALLYPEQTRLGQRVAAAARAHQGHSGFRVVSAGVDGFLVRMQMIHAAERTLDLQYFIFRGDQTGRLLTQAVLQASDRGVRVRILVDDGEAVPVDEQIAALHAHPSIEVRVFNPFAYRGRSLAIRALEFLLNAHRLDYRMHNKLLVVDNAVALLGGRNIGDEYFQVVPGAQFADEDVFVAGPITRELSATFDEYWNSDLSIPVAALDKASAALRSLHEAREALRDHDHQVQADGADYVKRVASGEPFAGMISGRLPLAWAHAQVVCDSPDKKKVLSGARVGTLMQRAVAETVAAVQSELLIVTPYLIPGRDGMQLIEGLRARDVHVQILTNSLESSNVILAHAGYMHYRIPLLERGVDLYEVRSLLGNAHGSGQTAEISRFGNYSLHAKLFVFDRRKVFVGSMNFDQRSMHLNTEIGLIIDSPALAEVVAKRFEAMAQPVNSYRLALRPDPESGAPQLLWLTQEGPSAVVYESEPARSDAQRANAKALSLLPLDKEL
jgi:putative cardiolipin synthase